MKHADSYHHASRCGISLLARASLLVLGGSALVAGLARVPLQAQQGETSPPRQALAFLEEANRDRSALATLNAEWQREQAEFATLIATLEAERDRLWRRYDAAKARTQELAQAATNARETSAALSAAMARAQEPIDQALARYQSFAARERVQALPTLSPIELADEPPARIEHLAARLGEALALASELRVELGQPAHGGPPASAHLLRAGLHAEWWLSLDATRAGVNVRVGGELIALEISDPSELEAIRAAVEMLSGSRTGANVLLPFPRAALDALANQRAIETPPVGE